MANRAFPKGLENTINGTVSYATPLRVAAVRSYTFSTTHATLADITGSGATVPAQTAALTSKTYTLGTFDAADTSLTISGAGADSVLVLYADATGTNANATNYALLLIDTGPGLPIPGATTGAIPITWNSAGIVSWI